MRYLTVTGVQTCALPICRRGSGDTAIELAADVLNLTWKCGSRLRRKWRSLCGLRCLHIRSGLRQKAAGPAGSSHQIGRGAGRGRGEDLGGGGLFKKKKNKIDLDLINNKKINRHTFFIPLFLQLFIVEDDFNRNGVVSLKK